MSFALKREQSLRKNIRRIVRKQLDGAVEPLHNEHKGTRDDAVHEVRKCFKRIRAVLRFIRPETGEKVFRAENNCFRDAARPLTEVRDAKILIETVDALVEHFKEHIVGRAFSDIRKKLQDNLRDVRKRVLDDQGAFTMLAETVREARGRVSTWAPVPRRWPTIAWALAPKRWSAIGAGLADTYRRAGVTYEKAAAKPTVEKLHEWRKQAKYLRYQLEVLAPIWPERLEELANEADKMGDLLGDDNDLSVLRQMLIDNPDHYGDPSDQEVLLALIDRRRAELTQEALLLGERFFQDRPREFARHLKGYWKSWHDPSETLASV